MNKSKFFRFIAAGVLMALAASAWSATIISGFSRGKPSARDVVLQTVNGANQSVYVAAYQLTNPLIIQSLVNASKRAQVFVVLDKTQQGGKAAQALVPAGVKCLVDTRFRIMHHKFIVVDGVHVETGSFNYSVSADVVNAENVLLIKDDPGLAAKYTGQWHFLADKAVPCTTGPAPAAAT
jgi:phosphatidylserine/phosphatidylglycerophosphate/cardiolipin synthase-like enzyme